MRFAVVFVVLLHGAFGLDFSTGLRTGRFQFSLKNEANMLKVDIDKLSLHVYTQSDRVGVQVKFSDASKIAELTSFKTNLKTFIYIHGWLEKVDNKGSVLVRDALLDTSDVNVIIVDWDECANSINYFASLNCVEGVGNYLGQALTALFNTYSYTPEKATLVGHSLGAHIAGYAGKYTNGAVGVIVGLDPAAPFVSKDKNKRLSEDDGQFVEAIHTSNLGVNYDVGDADFWPNGGRLQPGCGLNVLECAHVRAYQLYAESIRLNNFLGKKCDSYKDFQNGKCNGNPTGMMGGLDVDKSLTGDFYLATNATPPYSS